MHPDGWTAILAAAGTLAVALISYLTARVQANTAAVRSHDVKISALARTTGRCIEGGAPAGAGAIPARSAPLWNQLQDPGSTGALPPERFNDCGEECCAEIIFRQHGVEVQADYLRWELRGAAGTGVTDGQDLVRLLARNNVPATAETPPVGDVATRLQAIVAGGGQAVALGRWVSPSILHWVLVTRADTNGCGANDPWGGVRRSWQWGEFAAAYGGELVVVMRQPDQDGGIVPPSSS